MRTILAGLYVCVVLLASGGTSQARMENGAAGLPHEIVQLIADVKNRKFESFEVIDNALATTRELEERATSLFSKYEREVGRAILMGWLEAELDERDFFASLVIMAGAAGLKSDDDRLSLAFHAFPTFLKDGVVHPMAGTMDFVYAEPAISRLVDAYVRKAHRFSDDEIVTLLVSFSQVHERSNEFATAVVQSDASGMAWAVPAWYLYADGGRAVIPEWVADHFRNASESDDRFIPMYFDIAMTMAERDPSVDDVPDDLTRRMLRTAPRPGSHIVWTVVAVRHGAMLDQFVRDNAPVDVSEVLLGNLERWRAMRDMPAPE